MGQSCTTCSNKEEAATDFPVVEQKVNLGEEDLSGSEDSIDLDTSKTLINVRESSFVFLVQNYGRRYIAVLEGGLKRQRTRNL